MDGKLRKWGKITACITPGAWALFLLVALLFSECPWLGGVDVGMGWLCYLVIPLMYVGTAACGVWLVWAWRRRHVFSRPPRALAALNAAALLAGLPMIAASLPGYLWMLSQ